MDRKIKIVEDEYGTFVLSYSHDGIYSLKKIKNPKGWEDRILVLDYTKKK